MMPERPVGSLADIFRICRIVLGRLSRGLARPLLAAVAAAGLAGCSGGVLDPKGPIGNSNAIILLDAVGIMCVIVVPTIIATFVFAWWFRASNPRARFRPDFVYSGEIELLVWAVPLLVIMFLGGVIWVGSHDLDPFRPIAPRQTAAQQNSSQQNSIQQKKTLSIQVIALDWKWLFIYPDQNVASINDLVVPTGTPLHFSITSSSVMNAFFVPQLGSMIYAMNGMVTQLNLQATQPGDYIGLSAQFSGDGFPQMKFVMRAVPQDGFDGWLTKARGSGSALDRATYTTLAQPKVGMSPVTYRSVEPGLFDAVTTQKIPPGPGPANRVGPEGAQPPREARQE
jgi:cytochrome o ubiquinol oxidase subunit II